MARPLRILDPGAIYHITARYNQRQELFLDDEDRLVVQHKRTASLWCYQMSLYPCILRN